VSGGAFQHLTTQPPPASSQQSQGKRSTGTAGASATYSNLAGPASSSLAHQQQQSSQTNAQPHSSSKASKGPPRSGSYHHPHQQDVMSPPGQGPSGVLGTAISDFDSADSTRNPLHCLICNNVFDDPRLLACYHSFCAKCLDGRLGDTKVVCPLCG